MPKVGTIYKKAIQGFDYLMHYVLYHETFGPFVRIYKDSIDASNLVIDKTGLGILPAISKGGWKKVGFLDPGHVTLGPMLYFEPPYPKVWFYISGNRFIRLGEKVPDDLQSLEVLGTTNYVVLEDRLATGFDKYSYTCWVEYKRIHDKD
jgi:hypothetical protein